MNSQDNNEFVNRITITKLLCYFSYKGRAPQMLNLIQFTIIVYDET